MSRYSRPVSRLIVAAALASCATPIARTPIGSDGNTHGTALAAAKAPAGRSWRVGYGVEGCPIGAMLLTCEAALGPSVANAEFHEFATWPALGIEVAIKDDHVITVFVEYHAKALSPFVGTDPGGIGATATIAQVLYAYGPATGASDSIVSEFGEFPGAADHTITFGDRGLTFTFYDGALAHLSISKP